MPAMQLTQTHPGARARPALLRLRCRAARCVRRHLTRRVRLQIHAKEDDPWAEVDVLRELATTVPGAALHLYPGGTHLFTDASLDVVDAAATDLVVERSLALLARLG
jgi:dienelactone hydrolase